jgi:hypothetical protein
MAGNGAMAQPRASNSSMMMNIFCSFQKTNRAQLNIPWKGILTASFSGFPGGPPIAVGGRRRFTIHQHAHGLAMLNGHTGRLTCRE